MSLTLLKNGRLAMIGIACGLLIGVSSSIWYSAITQKPVLEVSNEQVIKQQGAYIGIVVDRTRSSYCALHPARILFKYDTVDNQQIPVILPVPANNFVWADLQQKKFEVLIPIPQDLPPGDWYVQSEWQDNCRWYQMFTGPKLNQSRPLKITPYLGVISKG